VPEGDNIYRQARELGARLTGKTVTALYARGLAYPALVGQTVTAVVAHGKHLLIDVGPRARLHVHLGMNGRVRVQPRAALTETGAARASLALATDEVVVVWSQARTVEVLRTAFAHAHPALRALGPDLLAPDFDAQAAVARARARPAETTLGELLLDQRVAAGLGNVYKSEVLFLERLDPFTPVARLDDTELARLYARARALMQANLGPWRRTTTADRSRGEWIPRGQGLTHVYRRHRRPCSSCGTPIAMVRQGTPPRSTYYCPRCQPARP
jgi:endonuclease-8